MKGKKLCPACQTSCGPRSFRCPKCSHAFEFDKIKKLKKDVDSVGMEKDFDWRTLKKGDRIKIKSGSGPYWPSSEEGKENIPMGYHGKFTVRYVDKDGIHAVGNKKEANGHSFIYMGEPKLSKSGLFKEPHKIVRLKPRKEK